MSLSIEIITPYSGETFTDNIWIPPKMLGTNTRRMEKWGCSKVCVYSVSSPQVAVGSTVELTHAITFIHCQKQFNGGHVESLEQKVFSY